MKKQPLITLKNISKTYPSPNEGKEFYALKDINLQIYKGDRIGIVGPNGAGKSTLLKIIAGITQPTSGQVNIQGKIVALTDLQAGFHPELSGYENILFNGLLIGMRKNEIEKKRDEIIQFADIGEFIHAPFYTYSAGMKFRLAFAVAVASEADVLLIDEVFIAGDSEFQKKILHTVKNLQKRKKQLTTIVCSHLPLFILAFSKQFFYIQQGKIQSRKRNTIIKLFHTMEENFTKYF